MALQNSTIARVLGLPVRLGGESHSGWLPPGAAIPLPTPVRDIVAELRIERTQGGYLLIREECDGPYAWDEWHETAADAEQTAAENLGVQPNQWVRP